MSVAKMSTRKLQDVGRAEGVNPSLLRCTVRFGRMPEALLERVARGSECLLIPAGNTIYTQDDGADAVYLLLDGGVRLEHRETDGGVVKFHVVGPHASFGDVSLLGEPRRYYTASTDARSIVIRTPLALLREALIANPELAEAWIHAVTSDLDRRGHVLAHSARHAITSPAYDAA